MKNSMYIEKGRSEDIPPDAIRLSHNEVINYMKNIIEKWPKLSEIWALKYGNPILSSAVVISNVVILNFYRKKLKLRNYGRFTLFIPVVFLPSIIDQVLQNTFITRSIILQEECPTCITSRSISIQLGTGVIYPLIATIAGTYMFGSKMGTFNLKSVGRIERLQEFFIHLRNTTHPFNNRLAIFSISHIVLSYTICYFQMKSFELLRLKLLEQSIEDAQRLDKS
ncbi:uncharacterized protein LOC126910527 isoform X2 [Daktulosphaira vitifoliae]|uniref:uncharacterized protein LOC126910527 isoform X2 n=1 Tax=Daktulosphaira vitifoliae TaxID=58002 RepID=UPI0021AAD9A7|nr:uncharacterized protein LOC126910527 isoform X2 [Daktulosphaira vitifoliae]